MIDAESRLVALDGVVKGMEREIGFAIGAKAVVAPLLAPELARRHFAHTENVRIET